MQAPTTSKPAPALVPAATVPDVRLMKASIPDTMKVKASGGMHSWQEAVATWWRPARGPSGGPALRRPFWKAPRLNLRFQPHAHEKAPGQRNSVRAL